MEGLYQVELLGRKRDVYFGMPAIEYVYSNIDFTFFQRMSKGDFAATDYKVIAQLVYAGLYGGCELNNERQDFQFRDVYKAVEDLALGGDKEGVLNVVGQAFSESNSNKYVIEKTIAAKGSKKKPQNSIGQK